MKKRDCKSGVWLLHALLLYAVVMATDEAVWMVVWYWGMGLFAAAAFGLLVLKGLLRGPGRGWGRKIPGLNTAWFAVWGCLGCYFFGTWTLGWLMGGADRLRPVLWVAALVLPAAFHFRSGRIRRTIWLLGTAAGIAGLLLQPAGDVPGEADAGNPLVALPYVGSGPVVADRGPRVEVCRPDRMSSGATLLVVESSPGGKQDPLGVVLVDSAGAVLQAETFDRFQPFLLLKTPVEMARVAQDPVLARSVGSLRRTNGVHHDVSLTADGRVRMLMKTFFRNRNDYGIPLPTVGNYFQEFSREGERLRTVNFFPIVKSWVPWKSIGRIPAALFSRRLLWDLFFLRGYAGICQQLGDVFDLEHANALAEIPEALPGVCARGDVLVSLLHCGLVGVLDLEQNRLVWTWKSGGPNGFHTPVWTGRGTVLLFENAVENPAGALYSRVVEVDLRSRQIVWSFAGQSPGSLYSASQGACQLLPNGNVLVTWSTDCRVQEVTRQGEVVWDYRYAPEGAFPPVESIYRAIRLCGEEQIAVVRAYLRGLPGAVQYAQPGGGANPGERKN